MMTMVVVCTDRCSAGLYYSRTEERCRPCARDSYQPLPGQNFCVDCPGDTQTDTEGAVASSQCKGISTLAVDLLEMHDKKLFKSMCHSNYRL